MKKTKRQTSQKIKKNVTVAMLCAFAFLCTVVIKIPVAFLTLDIKDSVIALCTLFFGIFSGVAASVIVPLLELILISDTGIYGFIMNVISSLMFCLPVGLIYKYKRTLKGALLGLVASVVSMVAVMMLANLVITPYYMNVPTEQVASLIPTLLLPFNAVKGVLNASIVMLLYKPLSRALKKARLVESSVFENTTQTNVNKKKSTLVTVVALCIMIISLVIIFTVLGGSISWFDAIKS